MTSTSHAKNEKPEQKEGISLIGKLMVTVAILVFLSTLGVVGFLIYKNLDKFIPPALKIRLKSESSNQMNPKKRKRLLQDEKSNLIDAPDPFAAPVDN